MFIFTIPKIRKNEKPLFPSKAKKPYCTLEEDNWNDAGYVTSFFLRIHPKDKPVIDIGKVKILHKTSIQTELPLKFTRLKEDFCSQGQTTEYYSNLSKLGNGVINEVLEALNDIVYRPLLAEPFRHLEVFEKSLYREETARKVFQDWKTFFTDNTSREYNYQFTFTCRLKGAGKPHTVGFDFRKKDALPHRLTVLIGKNGTGKTQILKEIALGLTNFGSGKIFKPSKPKYSKVFAISYSLFDQFSYHDRKVNSGYIYCGIKTPNGYADDEQFLGNFALALKQVKKLNRIPEWKAVVEPIIPNLMEIMTPTKIPTATKLKKLSSGQIMILATMTDIVANIQPESLLLFDEPETHLHPNAISSLIKSLYNLLDSFKSYAIVSTHSPIVIQEVPSRSIQVFEREGNFPIIKPLQIESFGENLTTITHEVFGVRVSESLYKTILSDLVGNHSSEEILGYFDNKLGFNAQIFLENASRNKRLINE